MGKAEKILRDFNRQKLPPLSNNIPVSIPNHSGDHSAGRVLTTPTTDTEIANKKYVDDQVAIGNAPSTATYITQTANATLSAEQALGALATGILKSTTTTGVVSIAAAGTDYYNPGGTDVAIADGGTNNSTAYTSGSVIYSDGTKLTENNTDFKWTTGNSNLSIKATGTGEALRLIGVSDTSTGMMHIRPTAGQKAYITFTENAVGDLGAIGFDNASTSMRFYTGGILNNGTVKMSIESGGNIGIGIASPANNVHLKFANTIFNIDTSGATDTPWTYYSQAGTLKAAAGYRNSNAGYTIHENGADRLVIKSGNVGFGGVTSPNTIIDSLSADNVVNTTLGINATQANVTAADTFIDFRSTTGSEGTVQGTAVAGVIAYNTFTGCHWSQSDTIDKEKVKTISKTEQTGIDGTKKIEEKEVYIYKSSCIPGTVLCGTKEMCSWEGEVKSLLPKCKVSDIADDKMVYGVYGGHDNDGDILVLGLGTGECLVCNEGGAIEAGDFLSTANQKGYAKKYLGHDMKVVLGKAREDFSGVNGKIAVTLMSG